MTATQKRAQAAVVMDLLAAQAPKVHYLKRRPMTTRNIATVTALELALARPGGIATDCSETVSLICHIAGFKNPSGFSYQSGLGNTETMWEHLPHYNDPAQGLVGGIVVFGPGGRDHTGMIRRRGKDPLLFSHGGEAGPIWLRLSVLAAALPAPYTLLSVNGLL